MTDTSTYGLPDEVTGQSLFDKIVGHLFTQGRQSRRDVSRTSCAYRGADGSACAVGCVIPDDRYTPSIESRAVYAEEVREVVPEIEPHMNLLAALQRVHDDQEEVVTDTAGTFQRGALADKLRTVAAVFDLDDSRIAEFEVMS